MEFYSLALYEISTASSGRDESFLAVSWVLCC